MTSYETTRSILIFAIRNYRNAVRGLVERDDMNEQNYDINEIKRQWLCPPDNRLIPYLVRSICIMWEARGWV